MPPDVSQGASTKESDNDFLVEENKKIEFLRGNIKMANFNVGFTSPLYHDVETNFSKNLDMQKTVKGFFDEMSRLMKDYTELSLNPDSNRTFRVGDTDVAGDNVTNPAVSLLLEARLAQIEQAQSGLLTIYDKMRKLEDQINSAAA